MKATFSHPCFLVGTLIALLPTAVLAGPDAMPVTIRSETRTQAVVAFHKKMMNKVLIACGVVEPAAVYVAPGYLETTGPAPMLIYRPPGPMRPRRVTHSAGAEAKLSVAPAASPAPAPAANPALAPAPVVPVPAPAPTEPEPSLLPESGAGNPTGQNPTDEMLSYFQRRHPAPRPNNGSPAPLGGGVLSGPAEEPSFLQTPQAPEQPVLPPSRATYHLTP